MLDRLPRKFRLDKPYVKHKLKLIETIAMSWGTMSNAAACSLAPSVYRADRTLPDNIL